MGKKSALNLFIEPFCGTLTEFLSALIILYHKLTLRPNVRKHFNTMRLLAAPEMKSSRGFANIFIAVYLNLVSCFY